MAAMHGCRPPCWRRSATGCWTSGAHFPHPQGGAAWLDDDGRARPRPAGVHLDHRPDDARLLPRPPARPAGRRRPRRRGLSGLLGRLREPGTAAGSPPSMPREAPDEKACYTHAFVVLAACSARLAALPGADDLLEEALASGRRGSSTPAPGCSSTPGTAGSHRLDPYRGREQQHARGRGAAGRRRRHRRRRAAGAGAGIVRRVVHWTSRGPSTGGSRSTSTPTGGPSWSTTRTGRTTRSSRTAQPSGTGSSGRGCCCTSEAARGRRRAGLAGSASIGLFDRAAADGWAVDGADGFVYTTDWDGAAGRPRPDALGAGRGRCGGRRAAPTDR